jgi:hypothetical protein
MHSWGDSWFRKYGEDLHNAGSFISRYCRTRAHLCIHWKEKWGTLRFEFIGSCIFDRYWPIHSIFYPGHLFYRFPKWMLKVDWAVGCVLFGLGIGQLIQRYQLFILRRAINLAVKKWPHIEKEITADSPFWELEDDE